MIPSFSVANAALRAINVAPNMTVREALNSAMTEEMHRDKSVYVAGEEVGQYHGPV